MTKTKIKYAIILFALLFFCLSMPRIFAIFKETKSKELNIAIKHPSYTVTFNPNQGVVNPTSIVVVYGHNYDALPTPSRTGFEFDGWYDALIEGNKVLNSTIVNKTENHTLFAHWVANQLIVNGDTIIDLIYSTSSQTATINEATNGTGNYTYIEKSETNGEDHTNYISLNGTEVTVAANTPAGTYVYVVTVTDTVSGSNIDVTYTINIGRKKIDLPTCGTFTYNKTEQTLLSATTEYNVINNTAINAGNYEVGLTPTSNYEWNDSTTSQKDVTCTIDPYDIGVPGNATVVPTSNKIYNGNSITPTPAVMVPLPTIMSSYTLTSSELSYTYSNNINVGEATITITGEGNYTGTITQNFIIVQPSNSITNLSVEPTGVVSWVNSVNATGYEISIDGMNWTSVPAGTDITTVNYLNAIVVANGTRTVYVRALDSESVVIADSTVSIDVPVYEVTFNANNSSYGTLTPSTYNVIAGATYTTSGNTLTLQDGRIVTAKTTKEIGYITKFDSWVNNNGTINSPTTIVANFNRDVKNITITFNSGSGEFDNSTTTNVVNYTEFANAMTKYSHTGNVNDNGVQSSVYGNYWTEANITGTERGDTTKAHVITLPGVNSLTVDIYYNGEDPEWDWATVWAGNHPLYTASADYNKSISGRLGGAQSGTYTVNENTLTNMGHNTFNIDGDSVTFGFVSDSGIAGEGYGYYAIVTGVAVEYQSVGTYKVPLKNGDSFVGWNTNADGSGSLYKTEKDLLKLEESTTLYAIFKSSYKLCKRATVLHTEQCLREDSTPYCQGAGYQYNETVTYGNTTTTSGVLTTGDAFDCDVNGDGTYDSETERFYYISRYDDASLTNLSYDERFVDDIAVLIYYSNTVAGVPGNTGIPYYDQGQNNMGPLTAISNLPTTSQWNNVNLYKEQRKILTNDGQDSTTSGSLPTSFSYSGYAARFLTVQEIYAGCSNGGTNDINAEFGLTQCKFLVENTMFTDPNNDLYGGWLETPYGNWNLSWHICGEHNHIGYEGVNSIANGTRPAIDVPLINIDY